MSPYQSDAEEKTILYHKEKNMELLARIAVVRNQIIEISSKIKAGQEKIEEDVLNFKLNKEQHTSS